MGPRLQREGSPPGVCKGRDDFLAALGLVALDGQEIVCAGLTPMSRLPRSRLTVFPGTPVKPRSGFAPSTGLS